jgi:hypothetical protein
VHQAVAAANGPIGFDRGPNVPIPRFDNGRRIIGQGWSEESSQELMRTGGGLFHLGARFRRHSTGRLPLI